MAHNQYVLQLEKAGFLTLPLPLGDQLATLTQQVMANDNFSAPPVPQDAQVMAALRQQIKHVIYIIKENRTYDQVLGDLGRGQRRSRDRQVRRADHAQLPRAGARIRGPGQLLCLRRESAARAGPGARRRGRATRA